MPELEDLEVEQLDSLLDNIGSVGANRTDLHREEVERALGEPEQPRDEPVAEEPVTEETPEPPVVEEPVEAAPSEEVPEKTPEPTVEELDRQILEKRLARAEESAKHWEQVSGRHGGALGHLRDKVAQLEAVGLGATPAPPAETDEFAEPETAQPAPTPAAAPAVSQDSVTSYVVAQALRQGGLEFLAAHPDVNEKEGFMDEIGAYVTKRGGVQHLLTTNDPIAAQRNVKDLFSEAYHFVNTGREAADLEGLMTRRADMISNLSDAKAQATISSGGSPAPEPTGPVAIDDMDEEQLEKLLDDLGEEEYDAHERARR